MNSLARRLIQASVENLPQMICVTIRPGSIRKAYSVDRTYPLMMNAQYASWVAIFTVNRIARLQGGNTHPSGWCEHRLIIDQSFSRAEISAYHHLPENPGSCNSI